MTTKKGVSHLEMILSFIIFISFLIFLFIIFPIRNTEQGKAGLETAETEILNFTDARITSLGVALNDTAIKEINEKAKKNCFYFVTELDVSKVIAKDDADVSVQARAIPQPQGDAHEVYINGIKNFYQVYYSPSLTENAFVGDCFPITPRYGLKLGIPAAYRALSYDKIKSLNTSYYSDYNKLHIQFSMPKDSNFGFIITDMNGKEIFRTMKEKTGRGGVNARNVPIQIAYTDGTFQNVILNIQSW